MMRVIKRRREEGSRNILLTVLALPIELGETNVSGDDATKILVRTPIERKRVRCNYG